MKVIDESHRMMESEEYKLLKQFKDYSRTHQSEMLLQKDLQESRLREQRLKKILEEDDPFYFCEHSNLLIRINTFQTKKKVHFENSRFHNNNLKLFKISNEDLSNKLEFFDNNCYALKELIKDSIKSIFKNSIKSYGLNQDVETLFKQVKNLRSNSLIHITKCYLNPISFDLDSAVNINVKISKHRTYKIQLQPKTNALQGPCH